MGIFGNLKRRNKIFCKLIEVGLILCLDFAPAVSEIECVEKSDTTICVNPNMIGDCHIDAADDYMHGGGKVSEVSLTNWMNDSCRGFSGE